MTAGGSPLGRHGEDLAARWYERAGFTIVARNWRCGHGEVDLIAARGRLVVFCEVKTRSGAGFGIPAEAVIGSKQRRVRRLAAQWLAERKAAGSAGYVETRFDVASVVAKPGGAPVVEVIEAAF